MDYVEGVDFVLEEAANGVRWIGDGPATGVRYSIKYLHAWEWVAELALQPRMEAGARFGQRVWLKRRHGSATSL